MDKNFGINEYLVNNKNIIKCTLKTKYSDFIVNEVDMSKNILCYDSNNIIIKKNIDNYDPIILNEDDKTFLKDNLSGNFLESFQKFLWELNEEKDIKEKKKLKFEFKEIFSEDKEVRSSIHFYIKKFKYFETKTLKEDNITYILINYSLIATKKRYKYTEFILRKSNWETNKVINKLSQAFKIKNNLITYAGTKDKRGITTQKMSIRYLDPQRIMNYFKNCKDIELSNIEETDNDLILGNLFGNQFFILLRNVEKDDNIIEENFKFINNGYINYYGFQRFGCNDISTNEIGKALLLKDYKDCFEKIILSNKNCDNYDKLKEFLEDKNFDIIKSLNRYQYIEKELILNLKKYGVNNYYQAISGLSKNLRNLYIHSFQSYFWNKCSSERLKKYGTKLQIGDYVLDSTDNVYTLVDKINYSKYENCDIYIPLLGFDTEINDSIPINIYKELLDNESIDIDIFLESKNNKELIINGSFRKLISKPVNFDYKIIYYNEEDNDILDKNNLDINNQESDKISLDKKDKFQTKGIILKFILEKSNYATMMIREILKCNGNDF